MHTGLIPRVQNFRSILIILVIKVQENALSNTIIIFSIPSHKFI